MAEKLRRGRAPKGPEVVIFCFPILITKRMDVSKSSANDSKLYIFTVS